MVQEQLLARGISDPRVLAAMKRIPRHEFVPSENRRYAYEDAPVAIGHGQTISQPYMVALMSESLCLAGPEKVLEIGSGSGYQAAILSCLCANVFTVERIEPLLTSARRVWEKLGIANIHSCCADGSLGWLQESPFDAIVVTAAAPEELSMLTGQLKEGGRLLVPIDNRAGQVLTEIIRKKDRLEHREICRCVFVPLVGKFGLVSDER